MSNIEVRFLFFQFLYHGNNWTRAKEVTKTIKKGSCLQIMIMLLSKVLGRNRYLNCHKLKPFTLETGYDF